MLLSTQNIFIGSGGLYLKSNCSHFPLLCSTLINCNASWSRFSIYTCSLRLVCWSSDRKIGYVCSVPFPLLSPFCSVKSFIYSTVNIPHASIAVCRVLSQSNGTFDSRDSGRGGRSNQWNLLVKWLAGTKLDNLPGLEMAHGWEPQPHTNLFTKPFLFAQSAMLSAPHPLKKGDQLVPKWCPCFHQRCPSPLQWAFTQCWTRCQQQGARTEQWCSPPCQQPAACHLAFMLKAFWNEYCKSCKKFKRLWALVETWQPVNISCGTICKNVQ